MSLKQNTRIIGQHALLSPSNYHWLDYDEEKLRAWYFNKQQAIRGDRLHAYAQQAIELKQTQPDNGTTVAMYINDAIGFRMEAEVPLYYSDECFGTADAVGFRMERGIFTLRISDLKTGRNPAEMKQLLIYAALFCLFFNKIVVNPLEIRFLLRIYQNDAIVELDADPADVVMVMSRIREQAALVRRYREED